MPKREAMTEEDLQSVIQARLTDCLNGDEASTFVEARLLAQQYYRGDAVGRLVAPSPGRSSVVSRDSAESIDSLMPGLMKIFVGSDKTGVFEPTRPEEQDGADQATDLVNWVWLVKNPGALIFHDWAKDALQFRLGIVKVWWQVEEKRRREAYYGLTEDELLALEIDDDDEIKSQATRTVNMPVGPSPEGQQMGIDAPVTMAPVEVTDIVFYRMHEEGCSKIVNVAPEDFFTDKRAISDETLPFAGHRFQTTVSDLIEDGFDRDQVENLPPGTDDWASEKTERNQPEDGTASDSSETGTIDVSMRQVWVAEVYLKVDYDGDGIAEWRKVTVAGPRGSIEILKRAKKAKEDGAESDIAEVDDHPFCTLTPYPTPHKLVGESVVDKVQDIQEVNTALIRGVLDNVYAASKPRLALGSKANVEDAQNWDIGHPIRTEEGGNVNDQVAVITIPFTAEASLKAMEYFDQRKEMRTGVSRLQAGLDPNAINKTATGVNAVTNFTQERQALVARIFAEGGVKRLFQKILENECKYQNKARVIKLRGKWVEMNPAEWSDEMDFTPSVGIGTGNKDQQLMHLQTIYGIQSQIVAAQGGLNGPLVTGENIYNTVSKIVENAGLKSAELYFTDPAQQQQQPQEQQPDPEAQKAQQEMQLKQQTAEADVMLKQKSTEADIANSTRKTEAEIELARVKAAEDARLKEGMAVHSAGMKEQQAQESAQQTAQQGSDVKAILAEFMSRQEARDKKQDEIIAALVQGLSQASAANGMPA